MSKLQEISAGFRYTNIARNDYNYNDEYYEGHPDALSTGDELGKGEVNGSIGSLTDIKVRSRLLTKNTYRPGNEYNAGTVDGVKNTNITRSNLNNGR